MVEFSTGLVPEEFSVFYFEKNSPSKLADLVQFTQVYFYKLRNVIIFLFYFCADIRKTRQMFSRFYYMRLSNFIIETLYWIYI